MTIYSKMVLISSKKVFWIATAYRTLWTVSIKWSLNQISELERIHYLPVLLILYFCCSAINRKLYNKMKQPLINNIILLSQCGGVR